MKLRIWFFILVAVLFIAHSLKQFAEEKYFLAIGSVILACFAIHFHDQEINKK